MKKLTGLDVPQLSERRLPQVDMVLNEERSRGFFQAVGFSVLGVGMAAIGISLVGAIGWGTALAICAVGSVSVGGALISYRRSRRWLAGASKDPHALLVLRYTQYYRENPDDIPLEAACSAEEPIRQVAQNYFRKMMQPNFPLTDDTWPNLRIMLDHGYEGGRVEALKVASDASRLQRWLSVKGMGGAPTPHGQTEQVAQFNATYQLFQSLLVEVPENMRGSLLESARRAKERHDLLAAAYSQADAAKDGAVQRKLGEKMRELQEQFEGINTKLTDFVTEDGTAGHLADAAEVNTFILNSYLDLKRAETQEDEGALKT